MAAATWGRPFRFPTESSSAPRGGALQGGIRPRFAYRRLADQRISKIGVPDVQYQVFGLDFSSTVRYNSLGIRDREPSQLDGVPKILLLGDSFVEGKGVAASETISARLEAELRARGGQWAVVNAGVDGTGTTNQLHLLQHLGSLYHPQKVILAVYLANDIRNNALMLDVCFTRARRAYLRGSSTTSPASSTTDSPTALRAPRGYHWKRGADRDGYLYVTRGSDLESVLDHSEYEFLSACGDLAARCSTEEESRLPRRVLTALGGYLEFPNALAALLLDDVAYRCEPRIEGVPVFLLDEVGSSAPQLTQAWDVTAFLLKSLREETQRLGADLLVVSLPSRIVIDSDAHAATFRAYGLPPTGFNPSGPEVRLGQLLSDLGISYLDLVGETRRFGEGRPCTSRSTVIPTRKAIDSSQAGSQDGSRAPS